MNKFDFKPYDKVLVRDNDESLWKCSLFSHFLKYTSQNCICVGGWYNQCIPFEGNEHLLGTANPYKEPYEPKDGDFITVETQSTGIKSPAIFHKIEDGAVVAYNYNGSYDYFHQVNIYRMNSSEIALYVEGLHNDGKDWDAEKKEIVDWKWKPKNLEGYYTIEFNPDKCFVPIGIVWCDCEIDNAFYKKGWVFKTEEEAKKKAKELNEKLFGKEN